MHAFDLPSLANAVILGLSIASIWLIAALGLTIIYGTIGVINMAHGELIMLGPTPPTRSSNGSTCRSFSASRQRSSSSPWSALLSSEV